MNKFPTIAQIKDSPVATRNKYNYIIGIDPGVNTGMSLWDMSKKVLGFVDTFPIHEAMDYIRSMFVANEILVRIEDSRKRTWFAKKDKNGKWIQTDKEVLKGAGSIGRDCRIWEDFLTDLGVDFEMVHPKNNKTKLTAAAFKKITGWDKSTSQHARDASMLCYGM